MRKILAGAAALGLLVAIAMPGAADAAQRNTIAGVKTDNGLEVGSQYRRYRRAYYRPYRAAYYRPAYRAYSEPYYAPGYYPAWTTPYSDYGYGYGGYGGYGYGYGYGYRPFISIGLPGFRFWF